jgi:hypothetical protein
VFKGAPSETALTPVLEFAMYEIAETSVSSVAISAGKGFSEIRDHQQASLNKGIS